MVCWNCQQHDTNPLLPTQILKPRKLTVSFWSILVHTAPILSISLKDCFLSGQYVIKQVMVLRSNKVNMHFFNHRLGFDTMSGFTQTQKCSAWYYRNVGILWYSPKVKQFISSVKFKNPSCTTSFLKAIFTCHGLLWLPSHTTENLRVQFH